MHAPRKQPSDVVVAFPTEHARRRAVQPTRELSALAGALHLYSTVTPLRSGPAASKAAILIKVRRLQAEIEALTTSAPGGINVQDFPKPRIHSWD
jgi:hypothetical protein